MPRGDGEVLLRVRKVDLSAEAAAGSSAPPLSSIRRPVRSDVVTATEDCGLELDSASKLGVTLLGQVVRHLTEAKNVLDFVTGQVDLDLSEALSTVTEAAYEANNAFEAASLLMNGAALEESWSQKASRPKAIFARHKAAVVAGAQRIEPAIAPMLIRSERPPVTRDALPPKPPGRSRPKCGRPTTTIGKLCGNLVVVLENGVLATGCSTHLPDSERSSYERQKAQTDAWHEAAAEHQVLDSARMMAETTELWLRRQARELGMEWADFCKTVGIDGGSLAENWQAISDIEDGDVRAFCDTCAPHFADTVAFASVGMRFLHSWAARQRPPHWADRSLPAGDWLLEVPPKAHAHRDELGLHLAASMFAKIATPSDGAADAVQVRESQITEMILGQFAHADLIRGLVEADESPMTNSSKVAPPAPGARPVNRKRAKKTRKQR